MNPVGLAVLAVGAGIFGFGLVDLIGSFAGFDVWGTLGIELPEILWRFSAYIELLIGGSVFQMGRKMAAGADAGAPGG